MANIVESTEKNANLMAENDDLIAKTCDFIAKTDKLT